MSALLVVEPTYRDAEHAAVNAALLEALAIARGPFVFAAAPLQYDSLREAAGPDAAEPPRFEPIEVMAPGGVRLRRMIAQWRTLLDLIDRHRPRDLVLLSAGPETLFAARALSLRHPAIRLFVVMHGNLGDAAGWRSRDPRRRLFDMRSGLAVCRSARIRLVVLEAHIPAAARAAGLRHPFLVWPHPTLERERPAEAAWSPGPRLRLAFVGTASRNKGFDDFLALRDAAGPLHEWSLAGKLGAEYGPSDAAGIERADAPLSRSAFLGRIRRADYAVVAFRPEYAFTASGSLLDCVTQRKPLIAVRTPLLDGMAERYGPMGHLCADLAAARALVTQPDRLRDAAAYAGFQRALDAMRADRVPAALARTIARDMADA